MGVDIGITYLSPVAKGNYPWLIHSYSQFKAGTF